jgi:glycosyltransferase involved in cell wall biosynthesis
VPPKVSVVLPVRNGENYLQNALESVLNQDYEDYELLVGINPSTDSTLSIAKSVLGARHPGIIRYKDSVSMPANFNRTAASATGEYIKFLCHDDELHPNALRLLIEEFERNSKNVLVSSYESFLGKERSPRGVESFGSRLTVNPIRSLYRFSKYANWLAGPSGVMVKSEAFRKTMFDENFSCAFDLDCWIRMSRLGSFAIVPAELYYSRIHPNQGTHYCNQGGFSNDIIRIRSKCLTSSDSALRIIFKIFR